jgi:hypothetical protein
LNYRDLATCILVASGHITIYKVQPPSLLHFACFWALYMYATKGSKDLATFILLASE